MSYNLDAIKQKIADLSGGRVSGKKKNRPKLNWFKPTFNDDGTPRKYEVRFLPYKDKNNQPFEEVSYYNNKQLNERRIVAPAQYSLEDPIFDLINELKKENTRETWNLMRSLRPQERFYAPIYVRGEEDKKAQIWELNTKLCKDIYHILVHPDYAEENMMDPDEGFDFTITVSDSGKKFGKYPVKNYDVQARRKPSKLAKSKNEVEEILASIPDLEEYFKSQSPSAGWVSQLVENFLAEHSGASKEEDDNGDDKAVKEAVDTGTDHNSSRGVSASSSHKKTVKSIEDAFADLDDDEEDDLEDVF